jgi:DNA-binding MarR family transcriptional regulator
VGGRRAIPRSEPEKKKPLPPEVACYVAMQRASERALSDFVPLLKSRGLSEPKYNVLRILRGAGERGLACQEIGRRMISRVPDVTRLIDRLEKLDLVVRERHESDRRQVIVKPTPAALQLLAELDAPVLEVHRAQFAVLSMAELEELERLLEKFLRTHS